MYRSYALHAEGFGFFLCLKGSPVVGADRPQPEMVEYRWLSEGTVGLARCPICVLSHDPEFEGFNPSCCSCRGTMLSAPQGAEPSPARS